MQERADLCLAGNHDLAVIGALSVEDFNGDAAAAVRWTQRVLSDEARSFLEPLAPAATRSGAALFHGSPVDPVWDYVLSEEGARQSLETVSAPLVMVGHSHVALRIAYDAAGALSGGLAHLGDEVSLSDSRWLLNPGSVGQPRGGDPQGRLADARLRRRPRLVPADRIPDREDAGGDPRRRPARRARDATRLRAVATGEPSVRRARSR